MSPTPQGAPLERSINARIDPQTAATPADANIGEAEFDGTVTAVTATFDAAVVGATATKRTLTLVNRGQSGAGTNVIATLDLVTGVNPPKSDEVAFTLSGTAANLLVTQGDVLAVVEAVTSTGTANPGARIEVKIARR